jgi:hypothetical protein
MTETARYGWASSFDRFRDTPSVEIRGSLADFLRSVSNEQVRAWDESIPPLQDEVSELIDRDAAASDYSAILEYELPLEFRRPDVIFLSNGSVYVLELKGKDHVEQADLDQAAGYARDLSAYHAECHGRPVHPLLVLTRSDGRQGVQSGVHVVGLDAVDDLVGELNDSDIGLPIQTEMFLAADAYSPLPTIVEASRELMESGELRRVHEAAMKTEPALEEITRIIHEAARTKSRRLILLTGIPGAGKTLVGLQIAHARFLDDLAVERVGGKPSAPAVYLSGNGPLVEVLQYNLKSAGGGGKAFVRGVKQYVKDYSRNRSRVPPEHVLIFDEAQRAWDAAQVAEKQQDAADGRSKPEHFIEFAERIPEWCVVLGLIGGGQEIHIGEEAGLGQWRTAVEETAADDWIVHGPPSTVEVFEGYDSYRPSPDLHLREEIRFHLAKDVDRFVSGLIGEEPGAPLATLATSLESSHYHLRLTRDLDVAKRYMWDRYGEDPEARFGLLASSRDRDLNRFGIGNDWNATKRVRHGPWFVEGDGDDLGRSCRALRDCVTEFGCQGLELDAALLAWGTDFIRSAGEWTNDRARRYQNAGRIRDPYQLRVNAYRVLLTRARDACVVFVPPIPIMDETFDYLSRAGFRELAG